MPLKDYIALALIFVGLAGVLIAACVSYRVRDALVMLMIWLAPMTELYDVNFASRDFYRGTVRGIEFSAVDILSISILLSGFLRPRRDETRFDSRVYWVPATGFFLLYFAYCTFSVAISDPMLFGTFELAKILRGIVIFLAVATYVRSERELKIVLTALALVICYEGFMALKQRYLWGVHRVFGTVDHSNSLSALLCICVPILIAGFNARLPGYLKALFATAIALSAVGVILTISRAGVVILGIGFVLTIAATMSFTITGKKIAISLVLVAGAVGLLAKSWNTIQARFHESTLQQEYGSSRNQGRGYYIRLAEAIVVDRPFGVGLNNWSYWVSNLYGPRLGYKFNPYKGTDREPSYKIPEGVTNIDDPQAAPAHNLAALTAGELGIPGLLVFGLLWARWLQMGFVFLWRRSPEPFRQIGAGVFVAILCMALQSLTEWVFRHSPVFYVFHILLGLLAAAYYQRRVASRAGREEVACGEEASDPSFLAPTQAAGVVIT